jgi:hypothetical protein
MVQAVKILIYIPEVTSSNLGRDTDYPVSDFFVIFLSPYRQVHGYYLKTTTTSTYFPNHFSLISRPFGTKY